MLIMLRDLWVMLMDDVLDGVMGLFVDRGVRCECRAYEVGIKCPGNNYTIASIDFDELVGGDALQVYYYRGAYSYTRHFVLSDPDCFDKLMDFVMNGVLCSDNVKSFIDIMNAGNKTGGIWG